MGSGFSAYWIDHLMDQLEATTLYGTLFTSDPNAATNPLSVEVVGSGFARVQAPFLRTGTKTLNLSAPLVLPNVPPGTVAVCIGYFDAPTNGNLIASDFVVDPVTGVTTPLSFPTGGTFVVPANQYLLGLDIPGT